MGMYDTLWVTCPRCNRKLEFQSKSGECGLTEYTVLNVPPEVAGELDGDTQWCECGVEIAIQVQCIVQVHII